MWQKVEEKRKNLHLEPLKEFLLQDPDPVDSLIDVSASVGVAGAEPLRFRPPPPLLLTTELSSWSSSAVTGSLIPFERPLSFPLLLFPVRTWITTREKKKGGQRKKRKKKIWEKHASFWWITFKHPSHVRSLTNSISIHWKTHKTKTTHIERHATLFLLPSFYFYICFRERENSREKLVLEEKIDRRV